MFLSSANAMMTRDTPSLDVDRSSSTPPIVFTAPSILSVRLVSTSSGAVPFSVVVTRTMGISMFGKKSTPSEP